MGGRFSSSAARFPGLVAPTEQKGYLTLGLRVWRLLEPFWWLCEASRSFRDCCNACSLQFFAGCWYSLRLWRRGIRLSSPAHAPAQSCRFKRGRRFTASAFPTRLASGAGGSSARSALRPNLPEAMRLGPAVCMPQDTLILLLSPHVFNDFLHPPPYAYVGDETQDQR